MKGTLHKTEEGWQVSHATYDSILEKWTAGKYPLHPYDVHQIEADSERFDNIEARIAHYPDVEFKIVKENVDTGALEAPYIEVNFAKLIEEKEKCEYSGLPAPSEYIGDITDEDKIEGILDRAMQPKEVREQILFLNWLLKHYSTEPDPEGFFYYADSTGKEATMLSIVQNYQKEWI